VICMEHRIVQVEVATAIGIVVVVEVVLAVHKKIVSLWSWASNFLIGMEKDIVEVAIGIVVVVVVVVDLSWPSWASMVVIGMEIGLDRSP
jgi:hypothetical protein